MQKIFYCVVFVTAVVVSSFQLKSSSQSKQILPEGFVEIPKGNVILRTGYDFGMKELKDSTEGFYISSTEVSNGQYQEFLLDLKTSNRLKEYHENVPDTTVWRDLLAYNEPYVTYYFRHDAYQNYPVVGVSKSQMQNFATWKSKKYNSEHPENHLTFKLPTKKQWIRAGRGANYSRYSNRGLLRGRSDEKDKRKRHRFMYNFKYVGPEAVHRDEESRNYTVVHVGYGQLQDGALITAEVKSYWPNQFGIYNMCGNVAEVIADDSLAMGGSWNDPGFDVRVESEKAAVKPSSTIGFRLIAVKD